MLNKNNSILWDEYRQSKHIYENETLQLYMLGLSICIAIDSFLETHETFNGERELLAIKGMANNRDERYQSYAQAYGNDIEGTMGLVRPKLKELLTKNSVDPVALILYALTGMFVKISADESNELNHILLTLLQYETMGIDISKCKELWGHFAYTLDFESKYDANQMDGKEIKPIIFKKKYKTTGLITENAQNTIAEFVFMNMSRLDKEWIQLFSENPLLATGILSIKQGITADMWKVSSQDENGEPNMKPYENYMELRLSDINQALEGLIAASLINFAAYGSSFLRYSLLGALICMKICDGKELDDPSRDMLEICIKGLESPNSFPEGVSLENILYSLHRESRLPELYFLFFTILYGVDYGDFRAIAKSVFQRYC